MNGKGTVCTSEIERPSFRNGYIAGINKHGVKIVFNYIIYLPNFHEKLSTGSKVIGENTETDVETDRQDVDLVSLVSFLIEDG
jgi:hypothetical protein